jgi:hypothetical protein
MGNTGSPLKTCSAATARHLTGQGEGQQREVGHRSEERLVGVEELICAEQRAVQVHERLRAELLNQRRALLDLGPL